MTEVILPFTKVGEWWHDKKGQKGVMLSNDVIHWFQDHKARYHRQFLFGPDKSKWMILFQFEDKSIATLFKLTFGGR